MFVITSMLSTSTTLFTRFNLKVFHNRGFKTRFSICFFHYFIRKPPTHQNKCLYTNIKKKRQRKEKGLMDRKGGIIKMKRGGNKFKKERKKPLQRQRTSHKMASKGDPLDTGLAESLFVEWSHDSFICWLSCILPPVSAHPFPSTLQRNPTAPLLSAGTAGGSYENLTHHHKPCTLPAAAKGRPFPAPSISSHSPLPPSPAKSNVCTATEYTASHA